MCGVGVEWERMKMVVGRGGEVKKRERRDVWSGCGVGENEDGCG